MRLLISLLLGSLLLTSCTEEERNKLFKEADNILGKDMRVSYVADNGKIVRTWTVRDGKRRKERAGKRESAKTKPGDRTRVWAAWALSGSTVPR